MSNSIPSGWAVTTFDEVFTQISTIGKKVKTSETRIDGRFPVVDQGRTFVSGYLDDESLVVYDEKPLIIFGDHSREIKWIDFPFIPGADGVKILKPTQELNARFLYFFLRNLPIENRGYARHFKLLKEAKYLAPPMTEQIRIAQKLDEFLAQIDTLKTRIDSIPSRLKRFRQSVLEEAISGRLTEDWRRNHPDWRPTTIGDICIVSTGKTPKRDIDNYWENGDIPWLTSAVTGEAFCYKAEQFVTNFAQKDCSLKVFQIGTLLMAMYGEGKTRGQVTELKIAATCNQACAAITVDESVAKKEFVKLRLQENYEEIRKQAAGGAQPNLNLNKVREIFINLPPLEEQAEIVRRVEQLFAFADQLEAKVASAKSRIDLLTQSILAKAFRGELVPQAPNDEPASVLLERIKAQRAAAPKAKRGRKAATSDDSR